jgi:hypothetical protein
VYTLISFRYSKDIEKEIFYEQKALEEIKEQKGAESPSKTKLTDDKKDDKSLINKDLGKPKQTICGGCSIL